MIGMRMCEQHRIDTRKLGQLHAWGSYPRQKSTELIVEIRIGKHTDITKLQKQRRVADVCDTESPGCRRLSIPHSIALSIHSSV
jgi:hypothetical protein